MKILFQEPPPAQRIGGLEAAISALRHVMMIIGEEVYDSVPENGSLTSMRAVHFHGLWQPRYPRLAAQCVTSGVPYVVSPHGMLEPWAWRHTAWKKWPYYFLIERRFLRNASCILATAESEAARIRRLLPDQRVEMLPLGMTDFFGPDYNAARTRLNWKRDELVLLFLSRIHVKKGLDLLLKALRGMPLPSNLRLVVVGGGDARYVDSLKRFARENAAQLPKIDWMGEIWGEERWDYFQGADLFCLPTHSENFGLAVLEALQVGTPVLTTRTTPWVEYLTADRGLIADPTVDSLKESLTTFFAAPRRSPESRKEIASWAHATFSWSKLGPRYRSLYAGL